MYHVYASVMDPNANPLRQLAPIRRFQVMLFLSMMWTTVFCAGAGAWFYYGELMVAHLLACAAFLITGVTFRQAMTSGTYRDHPAHDGSARYDDVWGG